LDAIVLANPVVTLGTLAGNFAAVTAPNDGLTQTITEVTSGAGSRLQVEYTLHTVAVRSEITSLALYGAVSWTLKDGASDSLVTEVRVAAPGGGYAWEKVALNGQTPFQAEPPSSYVDASGNLVIRFTDTASIRRERKDTLAVDYLVGIVGCSQQPPPAPTVPANLVATANGSSAITLNWTDSSNETGYDIWRYLEASGWVFVGSAAANAVTYTDTGLAGSTTYAYVVRAFNAQSYADSAPASATTGVPALEMPENLAAKVSRGSIALTWTDTNTGETACQVWRAVGDGAAVLLATLPANAVSYTDNAVTKGVTYKYQVRAMLGTTAGPLTSPVSATAR
jgi:hypothetical protein